MTSIKMASPTIAMPTSCYDDLRRRVGTCTGPMAPGNYVTQVVPPPFYQIVAEEDQNTDEGSDIIPLVPPPPCIGDLHTVVDARNPFNGDQMPFCNKRLVTLQARQNPAADFFLFTDMDADPNSKIWSGDRRRRPKRRVRTPCRLRAASSAWSRTTST